MKIIINTPDISKPGGVANHYKGLRNYWTWPVRYNFIGGRKCLPGVIVLPYDFLKFFFLCWFGKYEAILLNPSLGGTAIKRDAVFLKIAKSFGLKVVVFIHGWNEELASDITHCPSIFTDKFEKADSFIVLASSFKKELQNWGISKRIFLATTKVDDLLLQSFDINTKVNNNSLLFLARIEENKGIFIAIEAFQILSRTHQNLKLIVAGTGSALDKAKKFVKQKDISQVEFLGNVSGEMLIRTFEESSIYILPTTHGEGMPTSVLEAMAFGLPVISRPVGGLIDFFEEGKMGHLIESLDPRDFADKINTLLSNPERTRTIGMNNHVYAKEYFMASRVALEIEKIISDE